MRLPNIPPAYRVFIYLITLISAACSILHIALHCFSELESIVLYVCAAASLFVSCCYVTQDLKHVFKDVIIPGIAANPFANQVTSDYRYRTILFSLSGFWVNVIFAVFNGIIAMISSSGWYASLAVYYLLLSVMRSAAIGHIGKNKQSAKVVNQAIHELNVYRRCGFLFIIMSFALCGAVFLMLRAGSGKKYPGILIYPVAAYTFWKISISIANLFKARKRQSPLLMTLRHIGYADALVSMLSLQTAMFAAFAEPESVYILPMNGATGLAICLMILFMGIHMVRNSGKKMKEKRT